MQLGINIHDVRATDPNSPYSNIAAVTSSILGIKAELVRGISLSNTAGMQWCAKNKIGYTIICSEAPSKMTKELYAPAVAIAQNAGVEVVLEGPNEPDGPNFKLLDGYTDWISYIQAHQDKLHRIGDALSVFVAGPSIGSSAAPKVGQLPMDILNVHTYAWPHNAVTDIKGDIEKCRVLATPTTPVWITECGASTVKKKLLGFLPWGNVYEVTPEQQYQNLLKAMSIANSLDVDAFFLYELVDQHEGFRDFLAAYNGEENFGIFNSDWSPKPLASYLKAKT